MRSPRSTPRSCDDGAFVHRAARTSSLDAPIHLLFVSHGRRDAGRCRTRATLIVAGASSQATVVESYVGAGGAVVLHERGHRGRASARTRVLDHYKVQQREPSTPSTSRRIAGRTQARSATSRRTRRARRRAGRATTSTRVLDGEGARVHAQRPLPGRRRRSSSTTTRASTTRKPHCTSHELYKGILDGTARGVFNGKIYRPPGRAEDRRQADEQDAAAVRRRDDRHQAAAGDLRRRREVHARRDGRPARRRRSCSTCARAASAPSEAREPADLRVRQRHRSSRIQVAPLRDALESCSCGRSSWPRRTAELRRR